MANKIVITKLVDGPRNAIFHVFIKSDGVSGDITAYTIADPTVDFKPTGPAKPKIRLEKVVQSMGGNFTIQLAYDDLTDNAIWVWDTSSDGDFDFTEFGGLKDRSGLDGTGKLLMSTFGFDNAADQASFVLTLRKN